MINTIRFPPPLQRGDIIGITAPSAGIESDLEARLQFCLHTLNNLGYKVHEGHCLRSNKMVSASAIERAEELTAMLCDDAIQAIFPPWGGELLIDVLHLMDFDLLARVTPKWILGYSDITTFMLPYTLITKTATAHGSNLLETSIHPDPEPLAYWNDVLTLEPGQSFTQSASSHYQTDWQDWRTRPTSTSYNCTKPAGWKCLHHENDTSYRLKAKGRLIGGCLDVISMLPGSIYGDVNAFARVCAPDGLLIYLENADGNTAQVSRMLHHLKLAGWYRYANALLIGRSAGPQLREFTVRDALIDALGDIDVPVIYEMDIGHLPPQLILINGAHASICVDLGKQSITQVLS